METIGKVLRKGGADLSVHWTTQYEKLAQAPSDDEAEGDDIVFLQDSLTANRVANGATSNGITFADNKTSPVEDAVRAGLLTKASRLPVETIQVKSARHRILTRRRVSCCLATLLALLGVTLISVLVAPHFRTAVRPTKDWTKEFEGFGTESCIRLVDVDGDGVLDIIFSISIPLNVTDYNNLSRDSIASLCKRRNEVEPCLGRLVALRGNDSTQLWTTNIHAGLFELSCGHIDVNKDGQLDCIGTGRLGTVVAFNPINGVILWQAESLSLVDSWSGFNVLIMADYTEDGVPELLLAHSSDPRFLPEQHDRLAGRLILLNGKTGKSIGRHLSVPNKKETYMSPVLHSLSDHSQYILIGSGGETIQGSLLAISVPDLYRYVMSLGPQAPVPHTQGAYKDWPRPNIASISTADPAIFIEIHRASTKGVMVPPICVDMNKDGVADLLVLDFDGNLTLFNGQNLKVMWNVSFPDLRSYSSPAPGYFNDDDALDFMIQFGHGEWPKFDYSMAVIINGRNGELLWSLNNTHYDMSSSLIAQTKEDHRDLFLFRLIGRHAAAAAMNNTKNVTSTAKTRTHRSLSNFRRTNSGSRPMPSILPGNVHNRRSRVLSYSGELDDPRNPREDEESARYQDLPQDGDGSQPYQYYKPPEDENKRYFGRKRIKHPEEVQGRGRVDDGEDSEGGRGSSDDVIEGGEEREDVEGQLPDSATSMPSKPQTQRKLQVAGFDAEQFVFDRTTSQKALLLRSDVATTLKYNLTADDIKSIKAAYERQQTLVADGKYMDRRRSKRPRHSEVSDSSFLADTNVDLMTEQSAMMSSEERTTGALGDVDGDGKLDLLTITTLSASIVDPWTGEHLRSIKVTRISKINFELRINAAKQRDFIPIPAQQVLNYDASFELKMSEIRLRASSDQAWSGYLGARGDSVYGAKH